MMRVKKTMPVLVLLALGQSCVPTREPAAAPPRQVALDRARVAESRAIFDALLDDLLPGMGAADLVDREKPQQEFEQVCFQAGAPGAEAARVALCEAMLARLGPQTAKPARVWLLRQLERLAGEESVAGLAELLTDDDPAIRELARRALENNPSPSATAALSGAVEKSRFTGETPVPPGLSSEATWRIALINALAARGDPTSTRLFERLTRDPDRDTACAAVAALGELAQADAVAALWAAWRENEALREPAAAALLRCADRLAEEGRWVDAAGIYENLYLAATELTTRSAALRGLVMIEQEDALPRLSPLIRGAADPRLQQLAVRLAEQIPGEAVTRELVLALETAPPPMRTLLLDVLGARGDAAAKPAVIYALRDDEQAVRIAALRALESLGDVRDIVRLAGLAATTAGAERDAARAALVRLRGFHIDPAILVELDQQSEPTVRAELIGGLAGRHFKLATAKLLETAGDPDAAVRTASFEALGRLAGEVHLPRLFQRLVAETDDEVRAAAEDAVAAICLRDADRERRAGPVLDAVGGVSGAPRASLIRVLGRLQGTAALQAVRAALRDEDEHVVDAAVRALASWENVAAAEDLALLASQAENEAHHVLALRGLVRLVGTAANLRPEEKLEGLRQALALSRRDEERKLVLAALGAVRRLDALSLVSSYLASDTLRDEAAVAAVQIARSLAGEHPAIARAALDEVTASPVGDAARQQAQALRDLLDRYEGYIGVWSVAGPYSEEGLDFQGVFARAFAPETPDAEAVDWQPLAAGSRDNPWIFDLTRLARCHDCCVYVAASVWSESTRPARLELGSDDAVKVWLNGELVHSRLARRGLNCGEDRVDITLRAGKNSLLLKVIQERGGWGFCCGVRGPDGQPLAGVKFEGR